MTKMLEIIVWDLEANQQDSVYYDENMSFIDLQLAVSHFNQELMEVETLSNHFNPKVMQEYEVEIVNDSYIMDMPLIQLINDYYLYELLEKYGYGEDKKSLRSEWDPDTKEYKIIYNDEVIDTAADTDIRDYLMNEYTTAFHIN